MVERVALYWGSAPTVCDGTSRQPRVGVATRPPVTFRVVDAAAEVDLDYVPELLGEMERLQAILWAWLALGINRPTRPKTA